LFAVTALLCVAQTISYRLEPTSPISRFSARQLALLSKLNHADARNLPRLGRIVVPNRWDLDELAYSPMPKGIESLAGEGKAVVVDLAAQAFGAYESGLLVRWGPVSSGDRRHQTPAGVYHLNWRAPVRVSSENPTWIMPWYFNFSADLGLALHQYTLPGRPASHGCVRLLAADAKWLYRWGEGWSVEDDGEVVRAGTLVVLTGRYDFKAPQPWLRPNWWAVAISIDLPQIQPADGIR
jgi:lipoprotein-anchoring transpeptidase ErfK/SrfK